MGRTVAVVWHASFSVAAGVLYFFFVLPRTPELLGDTSHTLGTVLRIVTGALIGLAALPVFFTLLRTRRPEFGVPRLALRLRTASIALHVLAGALIIGAAIAEIWLSLDTAGQWLFGVYGAAAAVALLAILAFYLAFAAELPPPPPKPLKVKQRTSRRRRKKAAEDSESDDSLEADGTVAETAGADETGEVADSGESTDSDEDPGVTPTAETQSETTSEPETDAEAEPEAEAAGKLQNRRPTGKGTLLSRRRRTRGGVAVED
jgi:hypothetical protein